MTKVYVVYIGGKADRVVHKAFILKEDANKYVTAYRLIETRKYLDYRTPIYVEELEVHNKCPYI